jgi:hypothetical protein
MTWIKYNPKDKFERDKDYLLVVLRNTLGDEPREKQRHVGHIMKHEKGHDPIWIIGNHFGWDMGDILYYQETEDIPND